MSKDYIDHIDDRGVVEHIDPTLRMVRVRLVGTEDCGGCPASKICKMVDDKDKVTSVRVDDVKIYHPGMKVVLRGSERLHRKAIMLATVLPCVALIAIMIIVYLLTGGNQLAAALSGAGAMVIFYFALWLMRDKVAHEFEFELIPID